MRSSATSWSLNYSIELSPDDHGSLWVRTHPQFWTLIGPFGDWSAAVALQAVLGASSDGFVRPTFTIAMNIQLHVDERGLPELRHRFLLIEANGNQAVRGFFDQHLRLWAPSGQLLATSDQTFWYKERVITNEFQCQSHITKDS